jgi:hypothetical protein
MTENLNLNEIKKNAYNSINQDGLHEFAMGIMFLCISIFLYMDVFLNQEVVMFVILPAILIGPFLQSMRKKFTYPRVGYANLISNRRTRIGLMVMIFALAFGIFATVNLLKVDFHEDIFYFMPLVLGLLLAFLQAYRFKRYQTKRYFIYFLVVLLATAIVHFFPLRGILRVMIIFTSLAFFQIPIGLITFSKFIKRTPITSETTE